MLAIYAALLAGLISRLLFKFFGRLKTVDYLPGLKPLFSPFTLLGALVPTFKWNPGLNWTWKWRSYIYRRYKSETISVVPLLHGPPLIYTTSMEIFKQIFSSGDKFFKAQESTRALLLWGDNVVSAEYETYKRHRRIVGPAFSSSINPLVWEETVNTYKEMIVGEGWAERDIVTVNSFNHYSTKLALIVISRCGFGLSIPWVDPASADGSLTPGESLRIVSENAMIRLAAPRWLYAFPIQHLKTLDVAYRTLEGFMTSFVASRRAQLADQKLSGQPDGIEKQVDLLTRLVSANEAEEKHSLNDKELIGNVFALLFAGHETTAHVISATLGLLALHPEEQDIAREQITSVLVDDQEPTFAKSSQLNKVLACFLEAARMFPPAFITSRYTAEPVTMTTHTDSGDRTFVVPAGTRIIVDGVGLHYNPRNFEAPETFRPSRWYNASDSDLLSFGFGPRSCLGKKFAMTEGVCFLTLVLRDWDVSPVFKDGETARQWGKRVLQGAVMGLTMGIPSVPLKLTRRR